MSGLAVMATTLNGAAHADTQSIDLWIGLTDNSNSGFLLDEDTGALWMTGPCLKPLETAQNEAGYWRSHTVELVSVGRSMAVLDQTFWLKTDTGAPQIQVESAGRGGLQSFEAVIDRNCSISGRCAELIRTQTPCEG